MLVSAKVFPAGPGEPGDVFPLRERIRFRDNLGLGLRHIRQRPAFATLARGPWHVFIGIVTYWQANAEAWPSQETIAAFSGYSSRAVRDYVLTLERLGILRLRRERRANGSDRIYYGPGLVTLVELATFVERFPRERAKALRAESSPPATEAPTVTHPPEAAAATPPEAASMEQRDQDQIEPSSCGMTAAPPPPVAEEQQVEPSKEDEEVARRALAERMAKKHPMRVSPRWFDGTEVTMVATCTAALHGDAEAKMTAQRDAITGAFLVSKDGPPTVRFIWEKLDHFLDHVERGRQRRLAEERAARRRMEPTLTRPKPLAATRMPDDVVAQLERLFGPGWRKAHVSR